MDLDDPEVPQNWWWRCQEEKPGKFVITMRHGAEHVRKVLSEHSYEDGTVLYKVQFGNFYDDFVSQMPFSAFTSELAL